MLFTSKYLNETIQLQTYCPSSIRHIFIFLHGKENLQDDEWASIGEDLKLEKLSKKYHMLIVLPHLRSEYYISHDCYDVDQFISHELPMWIRKSFCVSDDTTMSLGGVSMGGYGAVLIGAHHPACFEHIISVSGAFIQKDIIIGNPEVWGDIRDPFNAESFLKYFLPLCEYEEDIEKNPTAAIRYMVKNIATEDKTKKTPLFSLACGDKDWLYSRNLSMQKLLDEYGVLSTDLYVVYDGEHDAQCFSEEIEIILERLFNDSLK